MATDLDEENVGFFFVLPDNFTPEKCHPHMREAFKASQEFDPVWKKEEDCLEMSPTKRTIFVFQQFEGPAYNHLKGFKCVSIVGPRCLLSSLKLGKPIPFSCSPTFTAAMRELQISITGGNLSFKNELKQKIELMGGIYTPRLLETTTHLIVSTVTSNKYENACAKGVKVYTPEWVDAVWPMSLKENVHATDSEFDKYKCPAFLGLNVCSSNLNTNNTAYVKKTIKENGGIFDPIYTHATMILVVNGCSSEKFKVAKSRRVPCVPVNWVKDSVKMGYALPTKEYEINGTMTSSPTKGAGDVVEFDETNVSVIPYGNRTHIDETQMDGTCNSMASFCPAPLDKPKDVIQSPSVKTPVKSMPLCNPSDLKHLLQQLDVTKAKDAGAFLDGCGVFLFGWSAEEEDKLKRILKSSGAARFTELCDRTSHVLVGQMHKSLNRLLTTLSNKPHIVSIKWLIDSMSQKRPAAEDLYDSLTERHPEAPSPLSKKGMAILQKGLMSPDSKVESPAGANLKEFRRNELLKKYQGADTSYESDISSISLKPVGAKSDSATAMPPPLAPCPQSLASSKIDVTSLSCSSNNESELEEVMVFKGLKFILCDLSDEASFYVKSDLIVAYGGEIISHPTSDRADYAIVPLPSSNASRLATETVTIYWLEDCISNQRVCSVEFYHKPVAVDLSAKPLVNCVLSVSGYTNKARQFVMELSQWLGAVTQEVFARTDKSNAKASTHLICSPAERGQKYNAAVKWNLPAVPHEWLLACATSGTYVSVSQFLLNPGIKLPDRFPSEKPSNENCNQSQNRQHHDPEKVKQLLSKPLPPNPYITRTPAYQLGFSEDPEKKKKYARHLNICHIPPSDDAGVPQTNSPSLAEIKKRIISKLKTKQLRSSEETKGDDCNKSKAAGSVNIGSSVLNDGENQQSSIDGELDKLKKLIETPNTDENEIPQPKRRTLIQHKPGRTPDKFELGSLKSDLLKGASQPYAIMWEDPVNVNSSNGSYVPIENIEQLVAPSKEDSSDKKRKSSECCEEMPPQKKASEETRKKIVFLLSNVEVNKNEFIQMIKDLKAEFIDTGTFDNSATHLIIERPARSEKLLSAIARGIWVLHVSYLKDSHKKGVFLEEELYEWGSPKANCWDKGLKPPEKALSMAAHRWRSCLSQSSKRGAFHGMKFVLKVSNEKFTPFSRLITFGGGKVIKEDDAVKDDVCCVEHSKIKLDYTPFVMKGVVCVAVVYLNEFLISDPPPSPESKALPEYLSCREAISKLK